MLKIGTIHIDSHAVMAPMAGITNMAFRLIVKRCGAGLVFTEMVSAMGMVKDHEKTIRYLTGHRDEQPLAVQLFGSAPETMAEAAGIAQDAGARLIDINMGCPARKVLKTGAGGALLRDIDRGARIVSAVRRACTVPVTAKIRSGWSAGEDTATETALRLQDAGADGVTVHPRFVKQGFSGCADWEVIRRVKHAVTIPVIGNGDVFTADLAHAMRTRTGCDGVMIGRAAVGNPWIFGQVLDIHEGRPPRTPSLSERKTLMMDHFRLLTGCIGETRASRAMRGLLLRYTRGLPHSSAFRGRFTGVQSLEGLMSALDDYFATLEEVAE